METLSPWIHVDVNWMSAIYINIVANQALNNSTP